jgi:hypothetical protein
MRQQGAGGLSVITMARQTLGEQVTLLLLLLLLRDSFIPCIALAATQSCSLDISCSQASLPKHTPCYPKCVLEWLHRDAPFMAH